MWKQTLMAVYTRGEACMCIYLSPQIKWYDDDEKQRKLKRQDTDAATVAAIECGCFGGL